MCGRLQLDRPFTSSAAVGAVEYLRAGGTNPDTGAEVETAGWGAVDNLETRPDKLKEVSIGMVNSALCRRRDYFGKKFTANMMCANKVCPDPCDQPDPVEDSCDVSLVCLVLVLVLPLPLSLWIHVHHDLFLLFQGDSGGPLLYNGIVVGITSNGGKKCGQVKKPGIYTVISQYTEWIDSIMSPPPAA